MGKPKKAKPPVTIKSELAAGPEPPKKKKKKTAQDKPQTEWMFPPDEENSVLNPNHKSDAQRQKNEEEIAHAIKSLQYKSVTGPMKAPPPDLLVTLVGAFLSSYGFDSTSSIYTTQLASRKKLDAWKTVIGRKLPKGFPNLVKIYKEWYKDYQERTQVEEPSSSSDADDDVGTKESKKMKKAKKEAKAATKARERAAANVVAKNETSSSGSSEEESSSDVEMKDSSQASMTTKKAAKALKFKPRSPSTSSASSDSDADNEKEASDTQLPTPALSKKPTVNGLVKSRKQKADSKRKLSSSKLEPESDASSSAGVKTVAVKSKDHKGTEQPSNLISQSKSVNVSVPLSNSSSSETSSPDSEAPVKTETAIQSKTEIAETSSDSSSSESDSEELEFSKPPTRTVTQTPSSKPAKKPKQTASDSSETLLATSAQKPSNVETGLSGMSITSSDTSSASAPKPATTTTAITTTTTAPTTKRKRSPSPTTVNGKRLHKTNAPFQRVPKDTPVDPKMASNAYRSYDYAERAHQDLSVTRGKGFTKEKNKKKRGSYKGGAIDVSGGKGVKFDD